METKLMPQRIVMWITISITVICQLIGWFFVIYWFIYGSYSVIAALINLFFLIPALKATVVTVVLAKNIRKDPSIRLMIGYVLVATASLFLASMSATIGVGFSGLGELIFVFMPIALIAVIINLIFMIAGMFAVKRIRKQSRTTSVATAYECID